MLFPRGPLSAGPTVETREYPPMARQKTEATELALAFGLAGVDPTAISFQEASQAVLSLTASGFQATRALIAPTSPLARDLEALVQLGKRLASAHPDLFPRAGKVLWIGGVKQSGTVTLPIDIRHGSTHVSVKYNSRVVYNRSPENLFIHLPSGTLDVASSANWYAQKAPDAYQELFLAATGEQGFAGYTDVFAFDRNATRAQRRCLQALIASSSAETRRRFESAYLNLCSVVSRASAEAFRTSWRGVARARRPLVADAIIRNFLRLDAVPYVLAGIDQGQPFAIEFPDITAWRTRWRLEDVDVFPDPRAGQPVVRFELYIVRRSTRGVVRLPFHAEVRWSHGKFCGNPEAKLYRDVAWHEIPGIRRLV